MNNISQVFPFPFHFPDNEWKEMVGNSLWANMGFPSGNIPKNSLAIPQIRFSSLAIPKNSNPSNLV